jgi:hypothetical protein
MFFLVQIALKEINMKKLIIFAMIFLFAGCAWDESGRRDNGRRDRDRHDTGYQHQQQGDRHERSGMDSEIHLQIK